MWTEREAFDYLKKSLTFGIRLGLERMNRLMELLGHPEKNLRCIHVAGTNGKGSVTTFCASILAAAGLRVGVFTSPYLVRFHERIRILDGLDDLKALQQDETKGEIPSQDFARLLFRVREAASQMLAEGGEQPTEFELITAVAFLYYQEQAVDVVALETGLGGRLDSTNVIERPLSVVITAIGYDHMDRLGSTIGEIASEKAGIIKPGAPVFLYDPDLACPIPGDADAVETVFRSRCAALNAPLTLIRSQQVEAVDLTPEGQTFRVSGIPALTEQTFRISLLGHYQPMNAAMAIAACVACRPVFHISDDAIRQGVAMTRWPARLELVRQQPLALVDGAHNRQGASALADSLSRLFPDRQLILICGVLQDKEYDQMLMTVLSYAGSHLKRLYCVTPDNPRALPAAMLAERARIVMGQLIRSGDKLYNDSDMIHVIEAPEHAAAEALALADPDKDLVCAFGSLYMAGSLRSHLGGHP